MNKVTRDYRMKFKARAKCGDYCRASNQFRDDVTLRNSPVAEALVEMGTSEGNQFLIRVTGFCTMVAFVVLAESTVTCDFVVKGETAHDYTG